MTLFPFGKHKHLPLSDVPTGYLEWVTREITDLDLRYPGLTAQIEAELDARAVSELIEAQRGSRYQAAPEEDEEIPVELTLCPSIRSFRYEPDRDRFVIWIHRHSTLFGVWLTAEELRRAGFERMG